MTRPRARPEGPGTADAPGLAGPDPELDWIPLATFYNDPIPWEGIAILGAMILIDGAILPVASSSVPIEGLGWGLLALFAVVGVYLLLTRFTVWLAGALGSGILFTAGFSFLLGPRLPSSAADVAWNIGSARFLAMVVLLISGAATLAVGWIRYYQIWSEPEAIAAPPSAPPSD